MGCKEQSANGYRCSKAPTSVIQGKSQKKGRETVKNRIPGNDCEIVSSRNGFINKTGAMELSMDVLTWKEEFS